MSRHFHASRTLRVVDSSPEKLFAGGPLFAFQRDATAQFFGDLRALEATGPVTFEMARECVRRAFNVMGWPVRVLKHAISIGMIEFTSRPPAQKRRVKDIPANKTCLDCGMLKLRAAFYTNSSSKDGLQSRCKMCDNANRKKRMRGDLAVTQGANENVVEHAVDRARREAIKVRRADVGEGVRGGLLLAGYIR